MIRRIWFVCMIMSGAACAQGVRYDIPPILSLKGVPLANVQVSLCSGSGAITGTTCSPQTQSFSGITLATTCPLGFPVTLAATSVCQSSSDALGNAGFWLAPGAYIYCLNGPNINGQCYNLTVPAGWNTSTNSLTAGAVNAQNVNGVLSAASFSGADWCAKAATAIAALNGSVGIVQINQSAGTSACASTLTVGSNVSLQFTQSGTWTTSCSGIQVSNATNVELSAVRGVVLTLPNSCANFSRPIQILSSTGVSVHGFEINGNGNNQAVGEQSHCIVLNDSNRTKVFDNYIHDCQGDGVIYATDASMTTGCSDAEIRDNSFFNIGRQFITLAGYGCNDWKAIDNHFIYGTAIIKSTTTGNAIHIEADNAGTGFNRLVIARNTINGTGNNGVCVSMTSVAPNPVVSAAIVDNYCSGTNTNTANASGILAFSGQLLLIRGNSIVFTGSTVGTFGITVQEVSGTPAALNKTIVADNTIQGTSSGCITVTSSASSGTGQSFDVHDNVCDTINTGGGQAPGAITVVNLFSEVDIHDNILTNLQSDGIDIVAASRFKVHHNDIRDFGLAGASNGIDITCNASNTAVGPGYVTGNRVGSGTTTGKIGIKEECGGATNVFVWDNDVSANATTQSYIAGNYSNGPPPGVQGPVPTCTAGYDTLWPDSASGRWKMCFGSGAATQIVASGNDINTSDQVIVTHLAAALPVAQGGTGVANSTTAATVITQPDIYNAAGTLQTGSAVHIVVDTCTLGTNCAVTLSGSGAFTSSTSYSCSCTDQTAAAACRGNQTAGNAVTFTGTGTDVLRYVCAGN